MEISSFQPGEDEAWDDFCARAVNATFQHTRKFLNYHQNRFKDASVVFLKAGKLGGVFPAAYDLEDPTAVVSHPGATFGGIVHDGGLTGEKNIEAFDGLLEHYRELGVRRLVYKALPYTYSSCPSQDDLYSLFSLNAFRFRADLASTIDLETRRKPSERRRRGLKKAGKSVVLNFGPDNLAEVYAIVKDNLEREHQAKPVHDFEELEMLVKMFPDMIRVAAAVIDGQVEAGVILFNNARVWHAQYIAASKKAYEVSALDAVFESLISDAAKAGARYFDFGTSNENQGKILNHGLYRYKSEFGGGGVAHEYYELDLQV